MTTMDSECAYPNSEFLTGEEGQVVHDDSKAQVTDEECKNRAVHNHATECKSRGANHENVSDKSQNGVADGEPSMPSAGDSQAKKKGKKREDRGIGEYSTYPIYLHSV